MRRISYKFPHTCDIEFELFIPFRRYLDGIESLADKQENFRDEKNAYKRVFTVRLAFEKTDFEKISKGCGMSRCVTDEADIMIILSDTHLKSNIVKPLPDKVYLVKAIDRGSRTEIFVSGNDSEEMKRIISEACR